jgi:hypothetical protein
LSEGTKSMDLTTQFKGGEMNTESPQYCKRCSHLQGFSDYQEAYSVIR